MKTNLKHKGFTLAETVIAIGIVTILLSTFLAVFGPATVNIRRSVNAQQADRLSGALELALNSLPFPPTAAVPSAFDRAYDWVLNSGGTTSALIAYEYRADPTSSQRPDSTYRPDDSDEPIIGETFITLPVIREIGADNVSITEDLESIDGRVFFVRLVPFQKKADELKPILAPSGMLFSPDGKSAPKEDLAFLQIRADFYALPSTSPAFFPNRAETFIRQNLLSTTSEVKPVFSRTFVVRR